MTATTASDWARFWTIVESLEQVLLRVDSYRETSAAQTFPPTAAPVLERRQIQGFERSRKWCSSTCGWPQRQRVLGRGHVIRTQGLSINTPEWDWQGPLQPTWAVAQSFGIHMVKPAIFRENADVMLLKTRIILVK